MVSAFGARQRHHPRRPARVLLDGRRTGCFQVGWRRPSRRYGTPHRAIVLQAIWSSVLALTDTYRALFTRVIYTEWIFFALMAAGVDACSGGARTTARLSHVGLSDRAAGLHPGVGRHRRDAGHRPVPRDSLIGLGMVLIGLPVYLVWSRRR